MLKKLISFVLATSIVTSIFLVPAAAYEQQDTEPETEVVEMVSNGIKFTLVEDDEGRTVTYMEDGVVHKTRYEFATGTVSIDGKCVFVTEPEDVNIPQVDNSMVPFATSQWLLYETTNSSLMSDVGTAADWASLLFALFGVSTPDISTIANTLAAAGYGVVYYCRKHYYKSPVETSRPVTASVYIFYADAAHNKHLASADLRPYIN